MINPDIFPNYHPERKLENRPQTEDGEIPRMQDLRKDEPKPFDPSIYAARVPSAQKHAVIIGSGIGGMGTALLLAKKGYRVTVLEKNDYLGGRIGQIKEAGFTFDKGPSWYLMPDVFEHFFKLIGEKVEDHLKLVKIAPSYKIFFKDEGKVVELQSDVAKDAAVFESLEQGSSAKLREYLSLSKQQYEIAFKNFLFKNYDSIFDFFTMQTLTEGRKLSVFSNMHSYVTRFFKSTFVQKIMEYQLVFLGSSPYKTPALYNIMSHIDFNMGVYYPMGGIYEVIRALEDIGRKLGVTFETGAPVSRIIVEKGVTLGVEVQGGRIIPADIVVSNADMHHTDMNLLPANARLKTESYWKSRVLAPSAFILYLGFKDKIPSLRHHNLLFSKDWHRNFSQIFDKHQFPDDPSIYVCAPGVTDPTVAPAGKENLFVLVPIPANVKYGQQDLELYKEKILRTLEGDMDIPNIHERIEFSKMYCAEDFEREYNSLGGTALGLAHTLMQTAVWRPNNVNKKAKGLYYVGAGTNPGIGMPICLISAELAYKRIENITTAEPLENL